MIPAHFVIGRLALQYIEEARTTTFLTSGLLIVYGIFVFSLMKRVQAILGRDPDSRLRIGVLA